MDEFVGIRTTVQRMLETEPGTVSHGELLNKPDSSMPASPQAVIGKTCRCQVIHNRRKRRACGKSKHMNHQLG